MEQYFYVVNGKRGGPVAFEALRDLAINLELCRGDKTWCKGMQAWQPAGSIPSLFDDLPPDLAPEEATVTPPPLPLAEPVAAAHSTTAAMKDQSVDQRLSESDRKTQSEMAPRVVSRYEGNG